MAPGAGAGSADARAGAGSADARAGAGSTDARAGAGAADASAGTGSVGCELLALDSSTRVPALVSLKRVLAARSAASSLMFDTISSHEISSKIIQIKIAHRYKMSLG